MNSEDLISPASPVEKNILLKIIEKNEQCFLKAEEFYKREFRRPTVDFSLTGTTAGQYCHKEFKLRYNVKLAQQNEEDFLEQTTPHEVAHAVSFAIHGPHKKPHGREWKSVMIQCFGLPPHRCHNYDTSKVKRHTKPYIYTCGCSGRVHNVGLIKHKRIQNGRAYRCKFCLANLEFSGAQKKNEPKSFGLTPEVLD